MFTTNIPASVAALHSSRAATRAVVVATAPVAAAVVWLAAARVGVELTVRVAGQHPTSVGLPFALVVASAAALAAWGSLALLERITSRARSWWPALALGVLAVSFLPVLAAEASAGVKISLTLMHIAVAAVLIPGLRHTTHR